MNKKQKEFLNNCKDYIPGTPFYEILIFDSGKLYNGFWGKNGYNQIILCVRDKEGNDYVVNKEYQHDNLFVFKKISFNIDIPNDLGCIRYYSLSQPLVINSLGTSSLELEIINENNKND